MPRATRVWIGAVTLSVFGPYVTGHVRTEQLAVIVSFIFVATLGLRQFVIRSRTSAAPILGLWVALLAVIGIATVAPPSDYGAYSPKSLVGGIATFTLPVALVVITSYWSLRAQPRDILRTVAFVVVGAMSVNAVLSLYCLYRGSVQVLGFLPQFWSSDTGGAVSTATLAFENGRYTGIFNQPAEAGAAYGIAVFCLIYLIQTQPRIHAGRLILLGTLIAIGGTLSVSKVFLLGALPITIVLVIQDARRRVHVLVGVATVALVGYFLQRADLLPVWKSGSGMLKQLWNPKDGLLSTFTAGRYGVSTGGSLNALTDYIYDVRPLTGFGAAGVNAPYDSLWVETFVFGGMVGVVIMVAIFVVLVWQWACIQSAIGHAEARLTGATLALAVGAAFGIPTLTGNRITTLFWLVLGTMMAHGRGFFNHRKQLS